jgi:hypothetical protein
MSVLENLNFIKQAAWFQCQTPDPVLIIQAAVGAAAPVIVEAATFGCLDFIRMRAGVSPWHSRGLRALINGINKPAEQDIVNGIYKFLIPAEKLLFFWFVVDLTTEFIALWHSQIFRLGACGPASLECHWSGKNANWVSPGHNIAASVSYDGQGDQPPCPLLGGTDFVVPAGWYWSHSFSLTPEPIFTNQPVGNVTTFLRCVAGGSFETHKQVTTPPWWGNKLTAIYMANGRNKSHGTQVIRRFASCDISAKAISGTASLTMSDKPFMNASIVPVNCLGLPVHETPEI